MVTLVMRMSDRSRSTLQQAPTKVANYSPASSLCGQCWFVSQIGQQDCPEWQIIQQLRVVVEWERMQCNFHKYHKLAVVIHPGSHTYQNRICLHMAWPCDQSVPRCYATISVIRGSQASDDPSCLSLRRTWHFWRNIACMKKPLTTKKQQCPR